MARTDKPETQAPPSSPTTQESAALPQMPSQATAQPAVTATSPSPKEAELREKERLLEEKLKQVEQRERALDAKDAEALSWHRDVTADVTPSISPEVNAEVEVLNNSAHAIGLYDGTPLLPGVTKVSRYAWSKMFLRDGKTPVPGARHHFFPEGGGKPDLQVVSVDNLSALSDEHAKTAISASSDAHRLGLFAQTDSRPGIREAISARLKALQAQGEKK